MLEEFLFYICVFVSHLNKYVNSWLQSSLPLFSFGIHLIRIFIFLLYLHIDYLSPTLGQLRFHSQDFCLI